MDIERAKELHGHLCPGLTLGIKMAKIAMEKLGIKKSGETETIGEEILAIVENNNCSLDGIQIVTGCTIGNNSLIYADIGKQALTLVRRKDWKGVRVYADWEKVNNYIPEDARKLFEKVVVRREGSEEEAKLLSKVWEEAAMKILEIPQEEFKVEYVKIEPIERAPIFENVRCSKCKELVMKPKSVDGICLTCADEKIKAVIGRGIENLRYFVRYEVL